MAFACLLAHPAAAQVNDSCETFYCTAYAEYVSGAISGYVEYYDDSEDYYLKVSVFIQDSFSNAYGFEYGESYDDAYAETDYTTPANGNWYVAGYPQYYNGDEGVSDGSVLYYISGNPLPTREDIEPCDPGQWDGDSKGGCYDITLVGDGSYDGQYVHEELSDYSENCSTLYRGPALPKPDPSIFYISSGQYYDYVGEGNYFVSAYSGKIPTGGSCSFTLTQDLYIFNPNQWYAEDGIELDLLAGGHVNSFRGGVEIDN